MRPILIHGHERALTKIRYNLDGDLLFSVAKDNRPTVYYSHNGERLGTFDGHNGACWDIAVNDDSTRVLTGAGDNTCRLWDIKSGKCIFVWETRSAVRSVDFGMGGRIALFTTDATMGNTSELNIVEIAEDPAQQTAEIILTIRIPKPKATIARWGAMNKCIFTGHEDGSITKWDPETGAVIDKSNSQTASIQDLQFDKYKSMFITASKDHTAMLHDAATLKPLKKYQTERNVNGAAISPLRDHIILGGGQEAMSVTTTSARAGKFEVRFFHAVLEEEIGRVKGHFGPINTVAFHPSGRSFASGGEDGYVRIHHMDPSYFNFKFDNEALDA